MKHAAVRCLAKLIAENARLTSRLSEMKEWVDLTECALEKKTEESTKFIASASVLEQEVESYLELLRQKDETIEGLRSSQAHADAIILAMGEEMDGLSSDLKCVSSNAQMEANASSLIREKLNAELSELKRWRADAERRLRMLSE